MPQYRDSAGKGYWAKKANAEGDVELANVIHNHLLQSEAMITILLFKLLNCFFHVGHFVHGFSTHILSTVSQRFHRVA